MPNRIIKESAFESEKIAKLTDFQFRLWVGLITQADDNGRGDARPQILKGHLFSLRDRVTVKDIDESLHALAAVSCVTLYTVDGRPYYQFPGWADHQRVRNVKSKYPGPEDGILTICGELPQSAASCGELRPESNPIQSESNPNPNTSVRAREQQQTASASASRSKRFTKPALEEVKLYCRERGNSVNPEAFYAHYEANGWMVGNRSMKDWKAAVRYWESNGLNKTQQQRAGSYFVPTGRSMSYAEYEAMARPADDDEDIDWEHETQLKEAAK